MSVGKEWLRGLAVVHDQVEERGKGETQGWVGVRLPLRLYSINMWMELQYPIAHRNYYCVSTPL